MTIKEFMEQYEGHVFAGMQSMCEEIISKVLDKDNRYGFTSRGTIYNRYTKAKVLKLYYDKIQDEYDGDEWAYQLIGIKTAMGVVTGKYY